MKTLNPVPGMIKITIKQAFTFFAFIAIGISYAYGQSDTTKLDDLSLKDLLNVKIVSVSKSAESLFDAPLSASVLTKEEIRRAGCTSIMEALRLVPGIIVREQTNGSYDIHLRGMDNVPPNAAFDLNANTTTLVMIDNRPIYNYLRGGTFWETLPVDINDVEKIEVVRGPAAALYGPNAVNGVINIITRQIKKDGLYIVANNKQGSLNTFINNASVGYQQNKWGIIASGNYQGRNRSQTSYFEFNRNTWLQQPAYFLSYENDTATNVKQRYPNPGLAMDKYAGNIFLNYHPSEKIKFDLSAGIQHSVVQKVSNENEVTPLSTASSISRYIDFRANINGLSAQFSYNNGTQVTDYDPGNKYDFTTFDASIEYNFTKGNFSLKPGLGYRLAVYDDTKYSDTLDETGIFNTKAKLITQTASLRGEYKLLKDKLRLVAALSANEFNYPDTTYISYEFAATYKINKKHLLRAVYSTASRSPTIFDDYLDQTVTYFQTGNKTFSKLEIDGNQNLKLLTENMLEIGYRGIINPWLNIDVELFNILGKNYNTLVDSRPYTELDGTDTVHVTPAISTNLPLQLVQHGITVSLSYSLMKLQIKPFITVQQTRIKNYSHFINTPDAQTPGAEQNNIYSAMGSIATLKSTPAVFGGASVNYVFSPKINVNINTYYYTEQTYYHLSNILFNDGIRGIDNINAKLIVNANIEYEPVKGLRIFCSGKNILNQTSREFFKSDVIPFMLLAGFNFEL